MHELIETVRKDLEVEKKNVVTGGSSKGGFAAIYFENKYDYAASIAGETPILLGNYLAIPIPSNRQQEIKKAHRYTCE